MQSRVNKREESKKKETQTKETSAEILYYKALEHLSQPTTYNEAPKPTRQAILKYIISISPYWRSEGYILLREAVNKFKGEEI